MPLRRPLTGLAVSFAMGTAAGLRAVSPAQAAIACALAAAAWFAARRCARQHRTAHVGSVVALHLLVVAVAALSGTLSVRERECDLATLREMLEGGEDVEIHGTVANEPAAETLPHGGARLRFDLRVRSIPDDFGGQQPSPFLLPIDLYGHESMVGPNPSRPLPRAGEGWRFQGRLRDATVGRGVPRYALTVCPGHSHRWPDGDVAQWMAAGWESRRRAADSLSSGIEHAPHAVAVLRAMVLGYRSELPYELRSLFANSGTVHIFAISGLHVGILAALLTAVLPLSRIPRPHWGWVLGPALILYTHISGASPSAMRACVMSLLFFAGPLLGRKPDALSALSAAAIGLLAVDPLQLAQLGFLFSFACVIALLTLSPLLRRFCQPRERDESTAFDDLVHRAMLASGTVVETVDAPPAKHRSLCWLRGVATASLSVSLAAWVASAPLTALYFGRLTPIAILGNLFAIPLATGIVLCGSLSLVGGLITPWLSVTFNCAALALVELLIRLTRQTVMLPGAVFAVEPWPPWVVLLWYLAALGLTVLLRLHLRRRAQAATMLSPRP